MTRPPVGFRADAGGAVGIGHFMRCLALTQAFATRGHDCTWFTTADDPRLARLATGAGAHVIPITESHPASADIETVQTWLAHHSGAWVVVDGYQFDAAYQEAVKAAGAALAVIDDDVHAERYCADVIVNQNLHAERLRYPHSDASRLLLGPRYAMIREAFAPLRRADREHPAQGRRVLVTFGGSDPQNQTAKALEAIGRDDVDIRVVLGPSNPRAQELRTLVRTLDASSAVTLLVDPPDMPELMAWADLSVGAAGSTSWELACLGVPAIVMAVAANQTRIAAGLAEAGVARNLGWWSGVTSADVRIAVADLLGDRSARIDMSERGRALVDGFGCDRVVAELTN